MKKEKRQGYTKSMVQDAMWQTRKAGQLGLELYFDGYRETFPWKVYRQNQKLEVFKNLHDLGNFLSGYTRGRQVLNP